MSDHDRNRLLYHSLGINCARHGPMQRKSFIQWKLGKLLGEARGCGFDAEGNGLNVERKWKEGSNYLKTFDLCMG